MRSYLILTILLADNVIYGQSPLPGFGNFSAEEINMKECSFDKNAEAVMLLDYAIADHDDDYRLITQHRIRIKIFNQREVDRGNIRIRFYSKDKFENITNIKALTYNEDGNVSYLDKKSIFIEKEDDHYSSVKFALPNVKPGSIIEYEYNSNMENYAGLTSWEFQHDIPIVKSCYLLTVIPDHEFAYNIQKKVNYPIIIKPIQEEGKIYFEMNDIPGLKFEPYMDAINDHLQKVEFQLAQYTGHFGGTVKVNQTWDGLGRELLTESYFGGAIKKDLSKLDEVKNIVAKETTDAGKMVAIYNYVRNNFSWNGYHSIYAPDGLKTVWEKRAGTAGEINLLLLNLLQTFNVEATPMLVAERDFGKIDTAYPFVDRFDKVVAYVRLAGQLFILDATQKYCPPTLIPFPLLNTIAFVVDKKNFRLIRILANRDAYVNNITIAAKLSKDGLLKGTGEIASSAYAKQIRTEKIKTDPKHFIKAMLEEPGSELMVDNCTFNNVDDDYQPLVQKTEFHDELNVSGGFIFLPCNFFTGLVKNEFTAEERFTNVNFGYPFDIALEATIQLPENCKIDKIPDDRTQPYGGQSIVVSRKFKVENNALIVTLTFKQTLTFVLNSDYESLKGIYQSVIDLLNEPVVIKVSP